jgi:tetratricopeptide (TPR) repeat protein
MVRWALFAISAFFAVAVSGQPKPEKLPISTWVREDLFAGFLVDDLERFESGVRKVEAALAEQPGSSAARSWLASSQMYRAVRAHKAGNREEFDRWFKTSLETFSRAAESPNIGVFAIRGGTFAVFADQLPAEHQIDAYRRVHESYSALKAEQAPFFDKLPVHMRGEVLAGLAQASARLGRNEEAESWLKQILETMPGTPYASRAKRWQEKPEVSKSTSLTCQTCHDPGRLEPTIARMKE